MSLNIFVDKEEKRLSGNQSSDSQAPEFLASSEEDMQQSSAKLRRAHKTERKQKNLALKATGQLNMGSKRGQDRKAYLEESSEDCHIRQPAY